MAKSPKFYVVWRGRKTGVFSNWDDCKKQINAFEGAVYKSFPSREMAEKAFKGNMKDYIGKEVPKKALTPAELARIGNPILDSIAVDAASSSNTNEVEYKGVYVKTRRELFLKGPYKDGTNNIGEFLAIVHALAYCQQKKIELPIYSDSRTAMSWVRNKKAKTKQQITENNMQLFDLIERAEDWLNSNTYKNRILKWETRAWGEIPADFGRK
ncbi:MAG: ribonuclease H family protein [Cyclobacteriaceae bacterium]